jgi:hypothetical protein
VVAVRSVESQVPETGILLFLNQGAIKTRPGIKACLIRPPEALAMLILFLNG